MRLGQDGVDDERGAAAVEFALLVSAFLVLVFGMVDYGLWFSDSMAARQGVRDAARTGVVATFEPCGTEIGELDRLRCTTHERIGTVTGSAYVRVDASEGWRRGASLEVCALVASPGVVGLVPLPHDGVVAARTTMSIEDESVVPSATSSADALPAGLSWTRCG